MSCCVYPVGTAYDQHGNPYVKHFAPEDLQRFGLTDASKEPPSEWGIAMPAPCDLTVELAVLSTALERAGALGLHRESLVVSAQALYDANAGMSVASSACLFIRNNLVGMAKRVEALNQSKAPEGGFQVSELGLGERIKNFFVEHTWATPVAVGVGGLLVLAVGTGGLAAGLKRGKRRRRR